MESLERGFGHFYSFLLLPKTTVVVDRIREFAGAVGGKNPRLVANSRQSSGGPRLYFNRCDGYRVDSGSWIMEQHTTIKQ